MDLIASSYGNSDSSEEDSDPWSASGVSTKRCLKEQGGQPFKRTMNHTRLFLLNHNLKELFL